MTIYISTNQPGGEFERHISDLESHATDRLYAAQREILIRKADLEASDEVTLVGSQG
jgi:hypothetical protein